MDEPELNTNFANDEEERRRRRMRELWDAHNKHSFTDKLAMVIEKGICRIVR
jgi:hypothetical protein